MLCLSDPVVVCHKQSLRGLSLRSRSIISQRQQFTTVKVCSCSSRNTASKTHREQPNASEGPLQSRRESLAQAVAIAVASVALPSLANAADLDVFPVPSALGQPPVDNSITHTIYLDVGLCPEGARQDRMVGDKSILCNEPSEVGRIVIGLYGNVAPQTVSNMLTAVRSGSYVGTVVNKIYPGEFIKIGQQGSHRKGQVEAPEGLVPNSDVLSPTAFKLRHERPGTVSLALSENDDDALVRERRGYRNLQFMITTGPGPVPSLDGENIVFGRVLSGMDTLSSICSVPTFQPSEQLRAYNQFATFIGDDRAGRARAVWGKPMKAIVITGSGLLT